MGQLTTDVTADDHTKEKQKKKTTKRQFCLHQTRSQVLVGRYLGLPVFFFEAAAYVLKRSISKPTAIHAGRRHVFLTHTPLRNVVCRRNQKRSIAKRPKHGEGRRQREDTTKGGRGVTMYVSGCSRRACHAMMYSAGAALGEKTSFSRVTISFFSSPDICLAGNCYFLCLLSFFPRFNYILGFFSLRSSVYLSFISDTSTCNFLFFYHFGYH